MRVTLLQPLRPNFEVILYKCTPESDNTCDTIVTLLVTCLIVRTRLRRLLTLQLVSIRVRRAPQTFTADCASVLTWRQ